MITLVAIEDGRHITHNALRVCIVLPRAREPRTRVLDVDLARGVVEAEEEPWQDRDWIFLVVNMRDGSDGVMCIDVVSELLVSDTGEAIAYEGDLRGGDMERDVDRVQERDRRA